MAEIIEFNSVFVIQEIEFRQNGFGYDLITHEPREQSFRATIEGISCDLIIRLKETDRKYHLVNRDCTIYLIGDELDTLLTNFRATLKQVHGV